MKLAVLLLAFLCISACTAQQIYNPGMNVAVKDLLIFKVRDIIIPELMEEFKQISIPDQGVTHEHYELRVYGMEADITPLVPEQITIVTDEPTNTLTVAIDNFHMTFDGQAYARALFIHFHGEAAISATIRKISFTIAPKLKADGDLNRIDYDIKNIVFDVQAGDIKFTKLTIGDLPSWLLTSITNVFVESLTFIYHEFEKTFDSLVVKVLDHWRVTIPDAVEIPSTSFSVSISFPNVPGLKADRIELPFDGTVFNTAEGYNPTTRTLEPIPTFNADDPNNIQVFLHQYVFNAGIGELKKAGSTMTVDEAMLSRFGLPTDILQVKWFSHLFPKLLCSYPGDSKMTFDLAVDPNLNSAITFSANKIHGEFSPSFRFKVGDDTAFTLSFRGVLDVDLTFSVEDMEAVVHGNLNTLDLQDVTFAAGTVPSSDLPDIIGKFKTLAETMAITTVNNMLQTGVKIPVIQAIKTAFEIDIETINLGLGDKFAAASLTVDVHQFMKILAGLNKYGYKLN
jgi:hypothetical protein